MVRRFPPFPPSPSLGISLIPQMDNAVEYRGQSGALPLGQPDAKYFVPGPAPLSGEVTAEGQVVPPTQTLQVRGPHDLLGLSELLALADGTVSTQQTVQVGVMLVHQELRSDCAVPPGPSPPGGTSTA